MESWLYSLYFKGLEQLWILVSTETPRTSHPQILRDNGISWWEGFNWSITTLPIIKSASLNMSANLENSAVATVLEKVSFHSNPKERQCQRMFKLLHNCIHLTRQQSNAQNSKPSFNSTRTMNFQMFKLVLEKAEEPEIKLPTSIGALKKQEHSRKTSTSALLTMPKPLTVWITINWKILKEMEIPDQIGRAHV